MDFSLSKLFSSVAQSGRRTPKRVVGIDVGSSSIKVVEIENTNRALMLKTYGELQLGPYAGKSLGEAVTLEPEKQVSALVDVFRESGVKADSGVLSIPLSSSFVTVIPISVREKESLEAKIHVEARKYIPVPLSDVTLDWIELNTYGDAHTSVHEVLLAAVQNDAYTRHQSLLASVKMTSQPSEIEVFSTVRSVFETGDTAVAIIDLGAETSKLYIARDGALERIHRVYEGGVACTRRIASLLEVSFDEAENMKRTYTAESPHARDIYKAYVSALERSVHEFKQVIEQYEARMGAPVARIALTGGASAFNAAPKHIGDLLSKEVTYARPFAKIAYPAFMEDTLNEIGTLFAPALGAALRPYEHT